ncbi:hypothetical protein [Mesorhizobium sp. CN2-181]|uniref:hypothetical protein n=1 Tax=Mesorhizobium yinganensis TaxID=3157707 RepID=UPI0032B79548
MARSTKGAPEKLTTQPKVASTPINLNISDIRTDGGTQSRWQCDADVVGDYAEAIAGGATFPPVTVFHDGSAYWLADGFHRVEAHAQAGKKKVASDVRQGTRRDAVLYSVGANDTHGLRRSNSDKRCAIGCLLDDPEWSQWSDREIARQCRVGHHLVAKVRAETAPLYLGDHPDSRTVSRGGSTYTMDTAAIGKSVPPAASEAPAPPSPPSLAEQVRADLPQSIKDLEQAKAEWRAKSDAAKPALYNGLTANQRIAELEQAVRVLEDDNEALKADNARFSDMRVQFEQGGFDKVVAGKDEVIRGLETRLYRESEDKAGYMRLAKHWENQAKKLGWSNEAVIPLDDKVA